MANENSNSDSKKKGWEEELLKKIYDGEEIPKPEKSLR